MNNELNNGWYEGTEHPNRSGTYEVIAVCTEPLLDNQLGLGYGDMVSDTAQYLTARDDTEHHEGWVGTNNEWKLLAWRERPITDLPDKYKNATFYNDLWATKCPLT